MAAEGVFSECAIAFVPSSTLTAKHIGELASIVQDNGATICEPRRDGSLPIEKATHIVSNTIDFNQFTESQAMMIPVVTTHWITSSVHRRKQANVRPFSPDPRMIFSEVVVTCGDLPIMDKESILGAVMALGGQEAKDANRLTTHICALSMDHPKIKASLDRGWKGKIVLPHWFDDCFKLGKRIDERPYLLPDPEILKIAPDANVEIPENTNLEGATSVIPEWVPLPDSSDGARPPATVFQDKNIMLCSDLKVTTRLLKAIRDIIVNGGGKLVEDVDTCDTFICQYRDGDGYTRAAQSCKDVGNLSWLYYIIVRNQWSSPLQRLMHYPIPRNGIEGFEELRITVSNYGGEARIYLENLIKACGADFTKTMKADNTHLITARNTSEKCKAAPEWGIAVINHLWIEECYAKCELKPYNIKKYNHFPPRTNLGEIIGQTFFEESRLRELYYPGGEETMSPGAKRKRKILEAAEDNAYQHGPAEGVVIGKAGQDRDFDVMMDEDGNEPAKKQTKQSAAVVTPARPRRAAPGKENDTPSIASTGGRSAKSKAQDVLHNLASDIALYEKEKKRHSKGTAPWGGKRAADMAEKEKLNKSKTPGSAEKDVDEEERKRPAKKARPSLVDVECRVVVTGYKRWVGDSVKEDHDRKKLRDMGIQIVQEGQPCDYLAAPQVVRTIKFLCALARGPQVINTSFLDKAIEKGEMPDPEKFLLKDKPAEERYGMKVASSTSRAKANRGQLLRGVPIYITENVRNGTDSYKAIADANGSDIFKIYRARSGVTIKPTTAEEDGNAPPEPVYLISTVSKDEQQMWPRFRDMAVKGNMEPRVVAPDWLLDVAMAQQMRFDDKYLVEKFFANDLK